MEDLGAVLARAAEAGVGPILAVGSDLATSACAVRIAQANASVFAAVGVHPHEAERFAEEKDRVRALLDQEKVVAVGEIGLDYQRGPGHDVQRAAFDEQLRWVRERGLPASIHNRGATADILAALAPNDRAILHCFSGSWEDAQHALELGCMISFAGNLTFPRADDLRAVAARIPADRLLVESDAPVLAPQPRRGRRNEPSYVSMTVERLADVRGVPKADLAKTLAQNAERTFRWSAA